MRELLKKLWLQSKLSGKRYWLSIVSFFFVILGNSQVNYVSNPSFELFYDCAPPNETYKCKYWNSLDSAQFLCGGDYYNVCYPNVPYSGATFQWPKTGNGYLRVTFYCASCSSPYYRTYPKNRLASLLTLGTTYCTKMFVNLTNTSPRAIDALGIYLADSSIDTIKYCGIPLSFLSPQIQNPIGNIINDTLNWSAVSGTFSANGNEKYLLIGNFKSNATTNTISTSVGSGIWSEYMIDDISVIDYNLPAYAGPDQNITLGDSAFIGRPPEVGLECVWTTGTSTVGTGGGIWVKPSSTGTFSYVVTQNICGNIKTDTVNVNISVGLKSENEMFSESISIYPLPAIDLATISLGHFYEPTISVSVYDLTGKVLQNDRLIVNQGKALLNLSRYLNGVYFIEISSNNNMVVKKLIISK